jgi:hypothetical protein
MFTENTLNSIAIMRDGSQLSWSVIPMISLVIYAFYLEADKKNWSRVLAALGFLLADLFNELINSIVCHWSGIAPAWGIKAETNYQLLIGWNIEIVCGFLLIGLASTMALPEDKYQKCFGINNRVLFIGVNSALSVAAEIMMNKAGLIFWHWPWWNAESPWLIFLLGYVPFFTVCYWIYDSDIKKGLKIVASYAAINIGIMAALAHNSWL